MIDEDIIRLTEAIIIQACKDYYQALCGRGYGHFSASDVKNECERFFKSAEFMLMMNLDGEYLIEMLKRKYDERLR